MPNRRDFLKTAALCALGSSLPFQVSASRRQASGYFSLHPFIENHPEAVFIMPTRIDNKMNAAAKLDAGLAFGRSVFVPGDKTGIPVTASIPVKMNLKTTGADQFPLEDIIGTIADPFFGEGVFEALKELGISGSQIHLRENPRGTSFGPYGIPDMAARAGIDFRENIEGEVGNGLEPGRDYNWIDVPDGVFFRKIPQLEPINTPGSRLLNISKFKTHGMGMTLCSKNLQGMIARPFCRLCARIDDDFEGAELLQPHAPETVKSNYERHLAEHIIPRWDRPGQEGGSWQEAWSHRTLDNVSVTPSVLNIIEGIYGRDGDCGNNGPHPFDRGNTGSSGGKPVVTAQDFMSNIVIFGKNIFRTDIVGHYLGGHEPGNFGYFHLAIERGLSDALDPRKIPVYLWQNGTAVLTPVTDFPRTPLLTYYLQRDWDGQTEPQYHLVDEPFDYSRVSGTKDTPRPEKPDVLALPFPGTNPLNPFVPIEYRLPVSGYVRLEIRKESGQVVDVLADGYRQSGAHLAAWDSRKGPSGTYYYRLRINALEKTDRLVLLK
ncbi:DUF362 domain-containing protein [bacterium]|nr:DUF362 domain-containing protein [bacterium]